MAKSKSFSGPYGGGTGRFSDTFESSSSEDDSDTIQWLMTPESSRSRKEIFGRQTSQPALFSSSSSSEMEVPIFDIREVGHLVEPHKIKLKPYSTSSIVAEASKIFGKIEEASVQFNFANKCVVLLSSDSKVSRLVLFINCFSFENNCCKNTLTCMQADDEIDVKRLKEIVTKTFGWQGLEIYKGFVCVSENDKKLQELSINDFDELKALEKAPIKVSFLYKLGIDMDLCLGINLSTSDSVKDVKENIKTMFNKQPLLDVKDDSVIQISRKTEVLKDDCCFVLSQNISKSKHNRIHVTSKNAVHCILKYPKRRQRRPLESKTIIFVDPDQPTSFIRNEAAKFVGVNDKAIKLLTHLKEPIEESENAGKANILQAGCKLTVQISKKLPIVLQHPSKTEPNKVAELFPLDDIKTVKGLAALHYGIDQLKFVLKCNGVIMQDDDLIQKYSLKKNTVLQMQIFEHRIKIIVRIVFLRRKIALVIDDPQKTTIEDILNYCAVKFQFRRSMSRCLFGNVCLDSSLLLETAGVHHGNFLNIVFFHEQEVLSKGLFKLYQGDQFGNTTAGYGSIVCGILLQAPEQSKPLEDGRHDENDTNQKLPEGIQEVKTLELPTASRTNVNSGTPKPEGCASPSYQLPADYSSASSSSGKDETYVKRLASSNSTHTQSVMKVLHTRPQFFVGDAESRNSARSAICNYTRPKISNEPDANSPAKYSVEQHASPEKQSEIGHHSDELNRQSTTEIRLLVRQSGTIPSGTMSDTALSNVRKLITDLSPEFVPTGEILETAGINTSLLENVSRNLGTEWKRLARSLKIAENCIDEIDHKYNSVSEKCYQALVLWKKQKGTLASKTWLVEGLKYIEQNALAEKIEDMDEAKEPGGYKTN